MTTSRNLAKLGNIVSSTGNINFTGTANVTLGAVGNLHITGGNANSVLTTDGTGNLSWGVGGGGTTTQSKTYYWKGGLTENVGTLRFYVPVTASGNITAINSYLVSPGLTQSTIAVKKNGTSINTITFAANASSNTQSGLSLAVSPSDYLTVDITQSSSASDLYINFIYQG